jgi:small subunit ribosomal protein S7
MPRRYHPEPREVKPDLRYNSELLARLITFVMKDGKRSTARRVIYDAMDIITERVGGNPLEAVEQAIRNASPMIEVKPRRVGGATYQVPVEVAPTRRASLAMRWLLDSAKGRAGKSLAGKLADEMMDAAKNTGNAIKRREDVHRMAEANKAFSHYRW